MTSSGNARTLSYVRILLVYLSMLIVPFIYMGVGWVLVRVYGHSGLGLDAWLGTLIRYVLIVLAVAWVILALFLKGWLLSDEAICAHQADEAQAAMNYTKGILIVSCLMETPALLGLVLTLLSARVNHVLAFGAVSIAFTFSIFPTPTRLRHIRERVAGTQQNA